MIIISGASRGIGQYLVEKFIQTHESVIGLYNDTDPDLKDTACKYFKVNICSYEEVSSFVSNIKENAESLVLINCAGMNLSTFAHKADPLKWKLPIEVNLIGTFNLINALLPIMREQKYGRIINFSSVVAQIGIPGTSAYAASKSALWGMTKSLAVENATKNITVNNINLGYFNIGMIKEVPEQLKQDIIERIPQKRLGDPLEIYKLIKYVIDADYLTGTNIDLNGGLF